MSTIRSGATGDLLMCCFNDCTRVGNDRYAHKERTGVDLSPGVPQFRIYVFCSERHLLLWRNSHVSLGNLPTGSRGTLI